MIEYLQNQLDEVGYMTRTPVEDAMHGIDARKSKSSPAKEKENKSPIMAYDEEEDSEAVLRPWEVAYIHNFDQDRVLIITLELPYPNPK